MTAPDRIRALVRGGSSIERCAALAELLAALRDQSLAVIRTVGRKEQATLEALGAVFDLVGWVDEDVDVMVHLLADHHARGGQVPEGGVAAMLREVACGNMQASRWVARRLLSANIYKFPWFWLDRASDAAAREVINAVSYQPVEWLCWVYSAQLPEQTVGVLEHGLKVWREQLDAPPQMRLCLGLGVMSAMSPTDIDQLRKQIVAEPDAAARGRYLGVWTQRALWCAVEASDRMDAPGVRRELRRLGYGGGGTTRQRRA